MHTVGQLVSHYPRRLLQAGEASSLDELVPLWIAADWPLERPRYVGRDLTWDAWLALPDIDETTR